MKKLLVALLLATAIGAAQPAELLIRCDDIGMCHAVNAAFAKVIEQGFPVSASVMFACPWYQEAVELLQKHPRVSVGVHLTLNAEWKNYRWGPVAGRSAVPSLVDADGYFFPSRAAFFANNPKIEEVETELRAQIDRALATGLRIDYVDYHMGTAVDGPDLRALVERLASEYKLGISRYYGEQDVVGLYTTSPERKVDTVAALVRALEPGTLRLMVFHIGFETPEMDAMVDLNPTGLVGMSRYRQGELEGLTSPGFQAAVKSGGVKLVTYRDLVERVGLEGMKRPGAQ